jgi:ribosomal protein L11 methyltransferase
VGSHSRRSARDHFSTWPRGRQTGWSTPLIRDSGSGARAGCRHKLVLAVRGQRPALQIAAALLELIEPAAEAVSTFEDRAACSEPGGAPAGSGSATCWRVEAYFGDAPDAAAIAITVGSLTGCAPPSFVLESVPDENWVEVSHAALPPVTAGRFTVHGSHDKGRVARGPWTIEIDAGEAFGTAHHATTMGCLEAIDRLARGRRFTDVLDLGCGTGVLAIAAQRLMARARVTASDIDPVACEVARANVRHNGALGIAVLTADGVPRPRQGAPALYDLVIANILARPLVALAPRLARTTTPGGVLVLSGLLTLQAQEVLGAYMPRGFRLNRHDRISGWSTLTLIRR